MNLKVLSQVSQNDLSLLSFSSFLMKNIHQCSFQSRPTQFHNNSTLYDLRGGEWVHCLFFFFFFSPSFRENVVVKCKIGSILYSLDNLLRTEKRNCFLFWKSNFKVIAHSKIKEQNLVLIHKESHQREAFTE